MKALVVSDVHGDANALDCVLSTEACTDVFCLGDGVREYDEAKRFHPHLHFHIVKGNCDWVTFHPAVAIEEWAGKRIEYMHGHIVDVKSSYSRAIAMAEKDQADVLLFGHTHQQYLQKNEQLLVCNPGSLARGEYAVLSDTNGNLECFLKTL